MSAIPEPVLFITIEDEGDDFLVLSFAIDIDDPGEVASLILFRDTQDHRMLPPRERGVHVTHELVPEPGDDPDFLRRISLARTRIRIETARRRYHLDISDVDRGELREAAALLRRMNFDHWFELDPGPF